MSPPGGGRHLSTARSHAAAERHPAPSPPVAGDPPDVSDHFDPAGPRPSFVHDDSEFDSIEEVDAVARSLRRVAVQYGSVVVAIFLSVPLLSLLSPWWTTRRVWGGLTPNFLAVAVGLHMTLLLVALLYNRVANRSEDEMLGRPEDILEWSDG